MAFAQPTRRVVSSFQQRLQRQISVRTLQMDTQKKHLFSIFSVKILIFIQLKTILALKNERVSFICILLQNREMYVLEKKSKRRFYANLRQCRLLSIVPCDVRNSLSLDHVINFHTLKISYCILHSHYNSIILQRNAKKTDS